MSTLGVGLQFILLSAYLTALQRSGTFARGAGAENAWELGTSNTQSFISGLKLERHPCDTCDVNDCSSSRPCLPSPLSGRPKPALLSLLSETVVSFI